MEECVITLEHKPAFWLGDKFYMVESKSKRHRNPYEAFVSRCPSCDDTRKIRYVGHDGNEYETECPICKSSVGQRTGNRIRIDNWEVHEYIVHKINAEGPTVASVYKDGSCCIDNMSLDAFCKIGRCADDYITTSVPLGNFCRQYIDPPLDGDMDMKNIAEHKVMSWVFRNKKDAEKLCSMLKEFDKERLTKFNETFHTDHEYPF